MNEGSHRGHRHERSGYEDGFAYDYHSESRSYRMGEDRRSESSSGMEHDRGDQRSNSAGNRYSDEGRGTGEGGPESETAAGVATMSINAPSAQDSWHGYDVDCPEANADK